MKMGVSHLLKGGVQSQITIHGRVLMHSTIKQRVGAHIRNETHLSPKPRGRVIRGTKPLLHWEIVYNNYL